jgi:hypothetical protein
MIHPQKREHVKSVLELVIRRMIQLRADLVKWNPPNSHVKMSDPNTGDEIPFDWEYVHLDDILVDLKLPPETLEVPVPKYFREDKRQQQEQRDRLVSGYMRLKHNTDDIYMPDKFESPVVVENMTLDRALEVIQRAERGRQGKERFQLVKETRDKERAGRLYDASGQAEMDLGVAATELQKMAKGFIARRAAARERDNELMFIAMKPKQDNVEMLGFEMELAHRKRKQEQAENKETYEKALEELKEIIMDEEGPDKREELREERILWVTDQIAQENYPTDLEAFYAMQQAVAEPAPEADAKDAKKGDKKGEKGDKKGKDDKKGGKKDKKGGGGDVAPEKPVLQKITQVILDMKGNVEQFEDTWEDKDESENFQQKHDVELGKAAVRPEVYEDLRKVVDEMLLNNLKKIQQQLGPVSKKGKGKGKKKGKKGKKGKAKKKKPLPGEKISELKGMDTDHMLSILIEHQLVVKCRGKQVSDIIGEFDYLGSMKHNADRRDEGDWQPHDPSISQIRQMLTEYCILPNGSHEIKGAIEPENLIKSVMLYGPSGAGKTLAVEAVAYELGALLIHLTPEKLRGQFQGKSGPTKLVHMVMKVAMDPTMQPVVIYIDDCEQFFTGGKKNKDKDGPSRFKKDLQYYKENALTNEHRVVILGTTKSPEMGDMKDLRSFFKKILYMPYPDYASLCLIWRHYLEQQIRKGLPQPDKLSFKKASDAANAELAIASKVREACERVDVSSLALVSKGYSAGAIARTIRSVVTQRRVAMLKTRPLTSVDFIDNLSLQTLTYQDDDETYRKFTKTVTKVEDRIDAVKKLHSGEGDGKKDDKKKGGKKK